MVKICDTIYPVENREYDEYFEKYPYELSSFQKYAIEAVITGQHVLVTAHTGSGKTLPAEFAIEYFVNKGKKVIYTSPIKALSNQKFYEFSDKFPEISFGILTGDIKANPEADVLIMTTEILLNTLYLHHSTFKTQTFGGGLSDNDNSCHALEKCEGVKNQNKTDKTRNSHNVASMTSFEMDFEGELACVIFDEIHYINDQHRGKVWEETIMLLPPHVQMVMLSATLDRPEKFATWCEEIKIKHLETESKIVYLASTNHRVVPLSHYSFISCTEGLYKVLKDKAAEQDIRKNVNKLHLIQDARGKFAEQTYKKVSAYLNLFSKKQHYVKRKHVLNEVTKYMYDNEMLPAICFVLSRKALEQCASEITERVLPDDSKVPYTVSRECEHIIRKLPNYEEYLGLPEYVKMVSLLEKGIAIHHAGVMPVLREIVEIMFGKGYVKLLFATETFAVGINMPTKTVLFTELTKYDGNTVRPFLAHEYTQMAGRAGRRGIDTVGHVIHLTNLFKGCSTDALTVKTLMNGRAQTLVSKFRVSYNLLLNTLNDNVMTEYINKSMIQDTINGQTEKMLEEIEEKEMSLTRLFDSMNVTSMTPMDKMEEYGKYINKNLGYKTNKERKDADKRLLILRNEYKRIEMDYIVYKKYLEEKEQQDKLKRDLYSVQNALQMETERGYALLLKKRFIEKEDTLEEEEDKNNIETILTRNVLTIRGYVASQIRETHCLIFSELICERRFNDFTVAEIVGIFSCFTNARVADEIRQILPNTENKKVNDILKEIKREYDEYEEIDGNGIDENVIQFDIIDEAMRWCECVNVEECALLLNQMKVEKEIFLGEFVKAILKINNISAEIKKVGEMIGDLELVAKLVQVEEKTLKYVATNQSLYV